MISFDELKAANQRAKTGDVDEPYSLVSEEIDNNILSDYHKMTASWILYYYLKNRYETIGSVASRTVLAQYLKLSDGQPSMIHSVFLRQAIKVSEKYPDFNFLEFLKHWDVSSFSEEDKQPYKSGDKEYPSLYETTISYAIQYSKSLDSVRQVFEDDDSVLNSFSKDYYFKLYSASKANASKAEYLSIVDDYLNQIQEFEVKNEFHSKILNSILFALDDKDVVFYSIFPKWGFNSFRDEDWNPNVSADGKKYDSLASKAILRYLKDQNIKFGEDEKFETLLKTAWRKEPENENFMRAYSRCLAARGKQTEAFNLIKTFIIKNPKWYLWTDLAKATEDKDVSLGYYCKALSLQKDDSFTVNVRFAIAEELISRGRYSEALHELNIYEKVYNQHKAEGWNLKRPFYNLKSKIPAGTVASESNESLYKQFKSTAEYDFYKDYPRMEMAYVEKQLIEDRNNNGRIKTRFILMASNGVTIQINPNLFGLQKSLPMGTCFDVRYKEETIPSKRPDGKARTKKVALAVQQIKTDSIVFKEFHGQLEIRKDRKGNDFAIIQDVYISQKFLTEHQTGETVKVLALSGPDRAKWQAYRLESLD